MSEWSGGIPVESSIYTAYVTAIQEAKHFIYVEVRRLVWENKSVFFLMITETCKCNDAWENEDMVYLVLSALLLTYC